jgi:hypothetical protein
LLEESTLEHPVDLLAELVGLVILHARQLRKKAPLALLGGEIAQQL